MSDDYGDYEPYGGYRHFCLAIIKFVAWLCAESIYLVLFLLYLLFLFSYFFGLLRLYEYQGHHPSLLVLLVN